MAEETFAPAVENHLQLIFRRLDNLTILPSVAQRFLSELLKSESLSSNLTEIINSHPALSVSVFKSMQKNIIAFTEESPSVRQAVEKLHPSTVRNILFDVNIINPFTNHLRENTIQMHKQLLRHSLAVACCAGELAPVLNIEPNLAYSAGLLHDIGKFALLEVMPKSLVRIIEQANTQNSPISYIEQKNLGLDHTIIGRRLTQKWNIPAPINLAVWLHHSDTETLSKTIPEAKIAQLVQLANCIAKLTGFSLTHPEETTETMQQLAMSLEISLEYIQNIRQELPEKVEEKNGLLGMDIPNSDAAYFDTLKHSVAQFATETGKLKQQNQGLQTNSSHFDFITEMLSGLNPNAQPIDTAAYLAARWQRFYQTGMVCIYLLPGSCEKKIEAVLVETLGKCKTLSLNPPADSTIIHQPIANKFEILSAPDHIYWLLEQLDVEPELSQTKLLPLLANGKTIGAIVFELRYPADIEQFKEMFKASAQAAASILNISLESFTNQLFAEQFSQLLTRAKSSTARPSASTGVAETTPQAQSPPSISELAEMAGGAAHELNNPLSIIAARAQLLADDETDTKKKNILKQIQHNSNRISAIIEDLMAFASPQPPKHSDTGVKQVIDEALEFAAQKAGTDHINSQIDIDEDVDNIYVDSAQMVTAVANIICNALESYTDETGPVKITASPGHSGDNVELQIKDLGRGMDAETINKATQPFFSAKDAGRRRGMGLSHAKRLIELNNGCLHIESELGTGTNVTITLPKS